MLRTKLYDKRDYFNFPSVNFSFVMYNNNSSSTCIFKTIYLSVDKRIFQSLWFLSRFLW